MLICPHCGAVVGRPAAEGGYRLLVSPVLVNDLGTVHGACPECSRDVPVVDGGALRKGLVRRRAGRVRLVIAIDR